jgi:hypothetical protein
MVHNKVSSIVIKVEVLHNFGENFSMHEFAFLFSVLKLETFSRKLDEAYHFLYEIFYPKLLIYHNMWPWEVFTILAGMTERFSV